MKKVIYSFLILLFISGCTTVSFLPTKEDIEYEPTLNIEIFWEEPEETYIIIGQLIAVSEVSAEEAFEYLKNRAKTIGAHAVIVRNTGESSNIVGISNYGGGTSIIPYTTVRLEAFAIRFDE